jgi:hypothetical protein
MRVQFQDWSRPDFGWRWPDDGPSRALRGRCGSAGAGYPLAQPGLVFHLAFVTASAQTSRAFNQPVEIASRLGWFFHRDGHATRL